MTAPPENREGQKGGDNLIKNADGHWSGAKFVLLLACFLCIVWQVREIWVGRDLNEHHTALLGILLVIGLLNRISARGQFRVRLGRDGAEFEGKGNHDQT